MYFLYVDESGDVGTKAGSSPKFALSGMVLHELVWHDTLQAIINFRKQLRQTSGLKLREEIHAHQMLQKPGALARIAKSIRLRILRDTLDFMEQLPDVSLIHIVFDKTGRTGAFDVFEMTWRTLLQRFHNTISHKNFPGPQNPQDFGLVITDRTDEPKLRTLARKLRKYNPVPSMGGGSSRQIPLRLIVEDAVHRDSVHSYFIQLVDVSAYFLYQKETGGSRYIRRKGVQNWFNRLNSVLCKHASRNDPQGIVRL